MTFHLGAAYYLEQWSEERWQDEQCNLSVADHTDCLKTDTVSTEPSCFDLERAVRQHLDILGAHLHRQLWGTTQQYGSPSGPQPEGGPGPLFRDEVAQRTRFHHQ